MLLRPVNKVVNAQQKQTNACYKMYIFCLLSTDYNWLFIFILIKLDACVNVYFSFYSLSENGCLPCDCSQVGSLNDTCSSADGTCSCLPFVTGDKCDSCQPGWWAKLDVLLY